MEKLKSKESRRVNPWKFNRMLTAHLIWLSNPNDPRGERLNLSGTNLSHIDERYVNMQEAILDGADLTYADLREANLRGASFVGADLSFANLSYAIMTDANLLNANLFGTICKGTKFIRTNFSESDMTDTVLECALLEKVTLTGAKFHNIQPELNKNIPLQCPEEGTFIAFKICRDNRIVKLEILADAKRTSGASRKCRASKAKVLQITDIQGTQSFEEAVSRHDWTFVYKVGEIVEVPDFNENRWAECSAGIHFFITKEEAVNYTP